MRISLTSLRINGSHAIQYLRDAGGGVAQRGGDLFEVEF